MPVNRLVEVRQNILKQNDLVARELRQRFQDAGVFVVSLVSVPGSGKTAFLEKTLTLLRQNFRVAALVGDLATDNDAVRLSRAGVPVKQITTGTLCHLEAAMVSKALEQWDLHELDFLFIENVGNLVCPGSYDLGENVRLVLLSVTKAKINRSNIRLYLTQPILRLSRKWISPKPSSSTRPSPRGTSAEYGRAWKS